MTSSSLVIYTKLKGEIKEWRAPTTESTKNLVDNPTEMLRNFCWIPNLKTPSGLFLNTLKKFGLDVLTL